MRNFIYSINEIFDPKAGCLFDYKVSGYFIAPYQRGYKWKSESIHDQVPVFLIDIYDAFKKTGYTKTEQEYYLQYITVKKNGTVFEVIDGQQRLTTLSLLYNILGRYFNKVNIAKYNNDFLVSYARYSNETENIFDKIIALLEIEADANQLKEQDKYYMLNASKCIKNFFVCLHEEGESNFGKFVDFLNNNVKIILNKEDDNTSAEDIFANLNDNKVPLTNAYLIKGLLLTKASRLVENLHHKHFKAIMDERAIMGRMWDEINTWFSKPEVSLFFFGASENGMENMLDLVTFNGLKMKSNETIEHFSRFFSCDAKTFKSPFLLFNKFNEQIITAHKAFHYLNEIKHIYKRLKSWYYDDDFYNLIGFWQIVSNHNKKDKEGYAKNIMLLLNKISNDEVLIFLKKVLIETLPTNEDKISKLGYRTYKATLFLLLAINVFPITHENNKGNFRNHRFDFYSYQKEKWSLEHIFPQNPNSENFNISDDKDWVLKKIQEFIVDSSDLENIAKHNELINKIKTGNEIDSREIGFVFESIKDHDDLGNMALLSGPVNSALTNGFFNTKRKILLAKINRGSFVPKHTIDVFSKMLEVSDTKIKFDNSLVIWSENDLVAHKTYLKESIDLIYNKFKPQ